MLYRKWRVTILTGSIDILKAVCDIRHTRGDASAGMVDGTRPSSCAECDCLNKPAGLPGLVLRKTNDLPKNGYRVLCTTRGHTYVDLPCLRCRYARFGFLKHYNSLLSPVGWSIRDITCTRSQWKTDEFRVVRLSARTLKSRHTDYRDGANGK